MRKRPAAASPILAALLAAALTAPAAAQIPRFTLHGTVVDSATGAPVVGAVVELEQLRRKVLTDSAGRFAFPEVAPAYYALSAFSLGYGAVRIELQAEAGSRPVLALPPDPVELAAIRVAVDSLEARRRLCACWTRLQQVVFGGDALAVSSEPNLRRFLDSLSYEPGPNRMFYHFAASGGRRSFREGGYPRGGIWMNEMPVPRWTLDATSPAEIARMELYRERGTSAVTIRMYTRSFLLHVAQKDRGLEWICGSCGSGERRAGAAH